MSNYSFFNILFFAASVLLLGSWIRYVIQLYLLQRHFPEIDSQKLPSPMAKAPPVSIIVAAKDEQNNIESCLLSLLSQSYTQFEVIVVDDRSQDNTGTIIEKLRRQYPDRMKSLVIKNVPEGWGGQNHALWQGVQVSQGEWLCFTDADCRFESPNTLTLAMHEASSRKLDLLSIFPTVVLTSILEKMYLPLCVLVLLTRLKVKDTNDKRKSGAYANGAFMLVRRDAYFDLGGHEKVCSQVNDDIGLAKLAKQSGKSIFVMASEDLLSTKMYPNLTVAWSGWTRNFSGTLKTSANLFWALVSSTGLFILPWVGFFVSAFEFQTEFYLFLATVLLTHIVMWRVYLSYPVNPLWSLLYLPGAVFVIALLVNALIQHWRHSGFVWHGVKYRSGE